MAHQRRDDNAVWTMWTRWEVSDEGQKEKEEPACEEAEATEEGQEVAL